MAYRWGGDLYEANPRHYPANWQQRVLVYLTDTIDDDADEFRKILEDGREYEVDRMSYRLDGVVSGANGWGVLHHAAYSGKIACTQVLLDYGASVDPKNIAGNTPAMIAAITGQSAILKYLLECGATARVADKKNRLLLHIAAMRCDASAMAEFLKRPQALIGMTCQDNRGRTVLHAAILNPAPWTILPMLVKRNADLLSIEDNEHLTPMQYAMKEHKLDAVKWFVCHSLDEGDDGILFTSFEWISPVLKHQFVTLARLWSMRHITDMWGGLMGLPIELFVLLLCTLFLES